VSEITAENRLLRLGAPPLLRDRLKQLLIILKPWRPCV
jgi:hypothetical protein